MTNFDEVLRRAFAPVVPADDLESLARELAPPVSGHQRKDLRRWARARLFARAGREADAARELIEPERVSTTVFQLRIEGGIGRPLVPLTTIFELLQLGQRCGLRTPISDRIVLASLTGDESFAELVRRAVKEDAPCFRDVVFGYLRDHEQEVASRLGLSFSDSQLESKVTERVARAVLALSQDPNALMALARVEYWDGRWADAIAHVEQASAFLQTPTPPQHFHEAWLIKARAHVRLGERPQAIDSIRLALEFVDARRDDPNDSTYSNMNLQRDVWEDVTFQPLQKESAFVKLVRPAAANRNVLALENLCDPESCDACLKLGLVLLARDRTATTELVAVMTEAIDGVLLDLRDHGDANAGDYALGSIEAYEAVRLALNELSAPPKAQALRAIGRLLSKPKTTKRKPAPPKRRASTQRRSVKRRGA